MFKSLCLTSLLLTSGYAFSEFDTTPPNSGAISTGKYRSVFAETSRSQAEINAKLDGAYSKMFSGTDDEKLYFTLDNDESYIKAIDSNDVRSEGMSWGMTVAVMMDKQDEFDKLWRFAYTRMRNTSGQYEGTYGWHARVTDQSVQILDTGPAPDGELYMAFALFNAAGRWGNGSGVTNYEKHANELLVTLKTHLMDSVEKQILFSPFVAETTDPSYHIPSFYDFFALVAKDDKNYWSDAANTSRTFLQNHFRQTDHGLASYLAEFSGEPKTNGLPAGLGNPGNIYEADAWRVAMNIGIDAHLSGKKAWHTANMNALLDFFKNDEGLNANGICDIGYSQKYQVDGTDYGTCNENNWRHDVGQIATNAVATLAVTDGALAKTFIDDLWYTNWPTGLYRYYHGSLYMLGLLHTSGQFKLYFPESSNHSVGSGTKKTTKTKIKAFKDGYVRGGFFGDRQYGKEWTLRVRKSNSSSLNGESRAVVAFDRSEIGNNGKRHIVKATLRLRVKSVDLQSSSATAGVFALNNRWQESGEKGATFNSLDQSGKRVATFKPSKPGTWKYIDVTEYVKNDSNTSRTAFMIRNILADKRNGWQINAKESKHAPELIIEWR